MKILHIDETFHPLFGYQINSLAKYQSLMGNDVYVITTSADKLHDAFRFSNDNENILSYDKEYIDKTGVKIVRVKVYRNLSHRAIFSSQLFKTIDEIHPDVVMLHQIETYASVMYMLKRYYRKYPTIADSHMLKMASRNKFAKAFNLFFRMLIKGKIIKNSIMVIRTQDDNYVNNFLGLPEANTPFVSFGSDLQLFSRDDSKRKEFREKYKIDQNAFVIIYTGKLDKAKGGQFLADTILQKFEDKRGREIVFLIVGNTNDDEYGRKVEETFKQSQNRIIRFHTQKYIDLPPFYIASDLSLFAKQCSLSFYDAQACGLPVVFENNNINVSRACNNNAFLFMSLDVEDFRKKINEAIALSDSEYRLMSDNAINYIRNHFDYEKISEQYTQLMQETIQRFQKHRHA